MSKAWSDVRFCCVLGLAMVAAVTGCAPSSRGAKPTPTLDPSQIDGSILTGVACAAPCWYGLEIGRSTKAEVLAVAPTLSFVNPTAFLEEPSSYLDPGTVQTVPATIIRLKCRAPGGGTCAALLLVNDVLKQIFLAPPPSLNLGELVDHLGPPEYVRVIIVPGSGTECTAAFMWKQRGIWVNASARLSCEDVRRSKRLGRDLPVGEITYESPNDYALAIAPSPGADFPWSGFDEP